MYIDWGLVGFIRFQGIRQRDDSLSNQHEWLAGLRKYMFSLSTVVRWEMLFILCLEACVSITALFPTNLNGWLPHGKHMWVRTARYR